MPALRTYATMPRPGDTKILRRIYQATRSGHALTTAGTLAGLGETVAWDWKRQGDEDLAAGEQSSHAKFARVVNLAEAQRVQEMLDSVQAAGKAPAKGWVPLITREQRRRPQEWGIQQDIHIEQRSVSVNVSITAQLSPEALIQGFEEAVRELSQEAPPQLMSGETETNSET